MHSMTDKNLLVEMSPIEVERQRLLGLIERFAIRQGLRDAQSIPIACSAAELRANGRR